MAKGSIQKSGRRKGRRKTGRNKHGGSGGVGPTRKISLQRVALFFPPASLQRIYFHGVWQQSHKRQPSLTLHNQRNPRHAFAAAQEMEGEYLKAVMHLPRFRVAWIWEAPELIVQAILAHRPIREIARML